MTKTVMVVDDSGAIRKFVMFALRAQGYHVLTAQDGMEALEKLAHHAVDLVVTDLNMPKLDGFSLLRAIRKHHDYAPLPVIILSSLSDEADLERGRRLGANAYLKKPFDSRRIQYEVAKYV